MTKSILIAGVGGQGTLLSSRILGHIFLANGYDVKVSEIHGMSQRGGSVVTYIRYGEKVESPIVDKGEADIIIAFEELEAARYLPYLKKGGKIITNTQRISPMPVITGVVGYNENIVEKIKNLGIDTTAVDALSLAEEAGNARAVNIVLMGMLSKILDFSPESWREALEKCVPPKALDINKKAFELGRKVNILFNY